MSDQLQELEAAEAAAAGASTRTAARNLAAAAIANAAAGNEGATGEQDDGAAGEVESETGIEEGAEATGTEGEVAEAGAEGTETGETAEETEESPDLAQLAEVEEAFAELGVELGVKAADLPPEMLPAYSKFLAHASDLVQQSLERELRAEEVFASAEQFNQRLQANPLHILLGIALSKPEVFNNAVASVQRMGQDPEYKDVVVRELANEVRQADLDRRESALKKSSQHTKVQQVISTTRRAAAKYNIPVDVAEEIVAGAIEARGGNIELGAVEAIVAKFAGRLQNAKPRPKIVTPRKAAAMKKAPTASVAGSRPAPANSPGLKDGSARPKGGGNFRNLIRQSMSRISAAAREQ